MAQFFSRSSNTVVRACLLGAVLISGSVAAGSFLLFWSPVVTQVNVPVEQPVPFSHQHHVTDLGIDCRYCHGGVETGRYAGVPSTEVCMTCHSQILRDAPVLEPVRASWREGKPISWVKVHDLPDYTYFNHQIHIAKGVACTSCHGEIGKMPLTMKAQNLSMRWCLGCHRHPEQNIRPTEEVFNLNWKPDAHPEQGAALVKTYNINASRLTDCSICHR